MTSANIRTYIYGILIMMLFIVGGVSILSQYQAQNTNFDSENRTGEFDLKFNKLDEVSSEVTELQSGIEEADTNFGAFGVLNALIQSAWNTLTLIFSSFSFMTGVFTGLTAFFGIPQWAVNIITLFITVTVVFSIYKMIFQTE